MRNPNQAGNPFGDFFWLVEVSRAVPPAAAPMLPGLHALVSGRMTEHLQGRTWRSSWKSSNCWCGRLYPLLHRLLVIVGLVGVMGAGAVADEPPTFSPEQLKAAFLLNFPKYVEWPADAFAAPEAEIVFGIVGDESLSAEIERLGAGKKANGRAFKFRRLTPRDELGGCHILFIAASQAQRTPELLVKAAGRSVLTVGEHPNFLGQGMIALAQKDRKITLEINLAAATAAQLKISSKLLGVATVKGRSG
jgi:hypothetical protein